MLDQGCLYVVSGTTVHVLMYYTCDEPIKPTVVASSTSLVYRPSPTFLSLAVDGTASDGKVGRAWKQYCKRREGGQGLETRLIGRMMGHCGCRKSRAKSLFCSLVASLSLAPGPKGEPEHKANPFA